MKLVYLAGPYSAPDADGVRINCNQADMMAQMIVKECAPLVYPFVPHNNTPWHYVELAPYRYFLLATMDVLRRCDAIYMLNGWENSHGSIAERAFAVDRQMPIFDDLESLKRWSIP